MKTIHQLNDALEDALQLEVMVINLVQPQNTHGNELHLLALHLDDAVTQNGGARIDSQYDALVSQIACFFDAVKLW